MKKRQNDWTDEEISADIAEIVERAKKGIPDEDELRRDAYFNDPANQAEIEATFARMELVQAMYKARKEAGLSQKEMARRMRTKQSYIAAVERGRKNITFSTLAKYARVCGKKIVLI